MPSAALIPAAPPRVLALAELDARARDYAAAAHAPNTLRAYASDLRAFAAWCRSLGVASHHSFEDWGRFLPEHTTAVSMLDRLLHHATTVITNGQSYRMLQARQRRGGPPLTP